MPYNLLFIILALLFLSPGSEPDTISVAGKTLRESRDCIIRQQYDSSLALAKQAMVLFREQNDERGYNEALFQKGSALQYMKEMHEAYECYVESSKYLLNNLSEKELFEIAFYNRYGGVSTDLGYRIQGRKNLEKAYELCKKFSSEDSTVTAIAHYNLGLSCIYFGENQQGIEHFLKALPVYVNEYGDYGRRVAQLYNNVGILYTEQGDYSKALDYFNRAVEIHLHNDGPGYWNLAYPYNGIASVYDEMGNSDTAFVYYKKAVEICISDPFLDRVETASRASLALIYSNRNMPDEAFKEVNTAVHVITSKFFDKHPRLIDLYRVKGEIYANLNDYDNAMKWFGKAEELIVTSYGPRHPKAGTLGRVKANVLAKQGKYDEAITVIDKAAAAMIAVGSSDTFSPERIMEPKIYLKLTATKADIKRKKAESSGNNPELLNDALNEYLFCVDIADYMRSGYLSEESKIFLQGNLRNIYENGLNICDQLYSQTNDKTFIENAFQLMEKSKASVLSESIQSHFLSSVNGVPDSILQLEETISRRKKDLRLNLEETAAEDTLLKDSLASELFAVGFQMDSLSNVIRELYPKYHRLKYNSDIISLSEVTGMIDQNATAFQFFSGDSLWWIMAVSRSGAGLYSIQKESYESTIDSCLALVRDPSSDIEEFVKTGNRIYETFLKPGLENNEDHKNLIIVSDGKLAYLPFEALSFDQTPNNGRPHYLIDEYNINYSPSLTIYFGRESGSREYKNNYRGFAPSYTDSAYYEPVRDGVRQEVSPLTGTRKEVEFAGKLFNGSVYIDDNATESNFKNHHEPVKILHLAMHAQTNDLNPMRSRLLFSQTDTSEDGMLNAYELYSFELESELAVLSACNTGMGELKRGEGVMSLSRAFMYAGCPNVVMSLWQARDLPTSSIMQNFFEYLHDGQNKDEALRNAKLAWLKNADPLQSHPANWATFVLIGDSKPVITGSDNSMLVYFLVIPLLIIATIFALLRKRRKAI